MLIDTHTHLDDARFDNDRDTVLARAREAGVETFITIGCDLATSHAAVSLADRYPFIYATIGVLLSSSSRNASSAAVSISSISNPQQSIDRLYHLVL